MRNLTAKQRDTLDFICERVADTGQAPTRAEIVAALSFPRLNTADCILKALEKKRFLRIIPKKHRGIEIIRNYL
jgi:repressor LexA